MFSLQPELFRVGKLTFSYAVESLPTFATCNVLHVVAIAITALTRPSPSRLCICHVRTVSLTTPPAVLLKLCSISWFSSDEVEKYVFVARLMYICDSCKKHPVFCQGWVSVRPEVPREIMMLFVSPFVTWVNFSQDELRRSSCQRRPGRSGRSH